MRNHWVVSLGLVASLSACNAEVENDSHEGEKPAPAPPSSTASAPSAVCGEATLAISPSDVNARALIDDAHLFAWTGGEPGNLQRIALDGGRADVLTAELEGGKGTPTLSGDHVYFTLNDTIVRVPRSGGAVEVLADELGDATFGLAVEPEAIYWRQGAVDETADGIDLIRKLDGFGNVVDVAQGEHLMDPHPASDRLVFFAPQMSASENAIVSVPKSGGEPTVLLTAAQQEHFHVSGDHVYAAIADEALWSLVRVPVEGGEADARFSLAAPPTFFDGGHLYMLLQTLGSDPPSWELSRAALDGDGQLDAFYTVEAGNEIVGVGASENVLAVFMRSPNDDDTTRVVTFCKEQLP